MSRAPNRSGAKQILVVGSSHRGTPLALRERLAVAEGELKEVVRSLREEVGLEEVVIVSTCNRVEVYAASGEPEEATSRTERWMSERARAPLSAHLYARAGEEAVRHAFRVASSLDSMVVGEPQILGQLKEAFSASQEAGGVGAILGRAFPEAFRVAKQVRHRTRIASGSVSISSVATDLAKKIFGDLSGRRALLVGAGEMGEAAARHLKAHGARVLVANRSRERAVRVAEAIGGEPRSLDELAEEMALADVVIASTSARGFVITQPIMRQVVQARRRRPIFLIDIAVPRDVDPAVGEMDNVFAYDVDDLQKVAADNLQSRKQEAEAAEQIVREETSSFLRRQSQQSLKPLIVELRRRFAAVLEEEIERTLPRLKGDPEADRKSLAKMSKATINKLLHRPITELKRSADDPDGALLVENLRRLFDLASEASEGEAAVPYEPPQIEISGQVSTSPSKVPALRSIPGGRAGDSEPPDLNDRSAKSS